MKKAFIIFILTLYSIIGNAQNITSEEYLMYSKTIQDQINVKNKSVCIIKYSAESLPDYQYLRISPLSFIKLKDSTNYMLLYNHISTKNGETNIILTVSVKILLEKYIERIPKLLIFKDSFKLNVEQIMLTKTPIKDKSVVKSWNKFYKEYPNSGGIFAFSEVNYSEDKNFAVFYYWRRQQGLSGHGELVVMKKTLLGWDWFYKINLWYN